MGGEDCIVEKDGKLNVSKGTIYAPDMMDLSESEVVGWLDEFGVVQLKGSRSGSLDAKKIHLFSYSLSTDQCVPPNLTLSMYPTGLGNMSPTLLPATSVVNLDMQKHSVQGWQCA